MQIYKYANFLCICSEISRLPKPPLYNYSNTLKLGGSGVLDYAVEDKEWTVQFHISESGNAVKYSKYHTEWFLTSFAVSEVSEQTEGVFVHGHLHALKVSSAP